MNTTTHDTPVLTESIYREVSNHLFQEAQLLDDGHFQEWLGLLTEDVQIRLVAPTLSMWGATSEHLDKVVVLMDETMGTLKTRVRQLTTPSYTVAENPRSSTRRFVTNILVEPCGSDGLLQVRSNALVYRSRGMQMEPHVFSMSRRDTLRRVDGSLRLAQRNAVLDEAVVGARNIAALF